VITYNQKETAEEEKRELLTHSEKFFNSQKIRPAKKSQGKSKKFF
jgi:hypothetical protein